MYWTPNRLRCRNTISSASLHSATSLTTDESPCPLEHLAIQFNPDVIKAAMFFSSLNRGTTSHERVAYRIRFSCRCFQQDTYQFDRLLDRKSTRLNSSHVKNSYAVFC